MGSLHGISAWDLCMGSLHGISAWDLCMGSFPRKRDLTHVKSEMPSTQRFLRTENRSWSCKELNFN